MLRDALRQIHQAVLERTPDVLRLQDKGNHVRGIDGVDLKTHPWTQARAVLGKHVTGFVQSLYDLYVSGPYWI